MEILNNASKLLADYIYDKLKEKEAWINLWEFQLELEDVYNLERSSFGYLRELPEYDKRFEIKGASKNVEIDSVEIRLKDDIIS